MVTRVRAPIRLIRFYSIPRSSLTGPGQAMHAPRRMDRIYLRPSGGIRSTTTERRFCPVLSGSVRLCVSLERRCRLMPMTAPWRRLAVACLPACTASPCRSDWWRGGVAAWRRAPLPPRACRRRLSGAIDHTPITRRRRPAPRCRAAFSPSRPMTGSAHAATRGST